MINWEKYNKDKANNVEDADSEKVSNDVTSPIHTPTLSALLSNVISYINT